MNGSRAKDLSWRVAGGITLVAAVAAAGFASTRASEEEVEHVERQVQELRVEVNQRLRGVETNIIKMCQLQDRQDKLAGGPGLDCTDPQ